MMLEQSTLRKCKADSASKDVFGRLSSIHENLVNFLLLREDDAIGTSTWVIISQISTMSYRSCISAYIPRRGQTGCLSL